MIELTKEERASSSNRRRAAHYNKGFEDGYAKRQSEEQAAAEPLFTIACNKCNASMNEDDLELRMCVEDGAMCNACPKCGTDNHLMTRLLYAAPPTPSVDLKALQQALHRAASQVGFLAIEDVDQVFASLPVSEPVAHAVFAENGNIIIWSSKQTDLAAVADKYGRPLTPLYAAPSAHMPTVSGVELAARFVEKRRDEYVQEHGSYDPSTGMTEFPGNGEEYVYELEEIVDGIRKIIAAPSAAPTILVEDVCPICIKPFKVGNILRPRPNAPGPVHAECLERFPDTDTETGEVIHDTLPTFLYGQPQPTAPVKQER